MYIMSSFNEYINDILHVVDESAKLAKCTGPTLPQLSPKVEYKWCRCAPNPYSTGYKRVFYMRRGKKVNIAKCLEKMPTVGTAKYYECQTAISALKRRIRKQRREN
jgi:hypothetical protein